MGNRGPGLPGNTEGFPPTSEDYLSATQRWSEKMDNECTMDIGRIKKLVKDNGDKFVFVENGEPELVVMSFREYEKLSEHQYSKSRSPSPESRTALFDEPLGLIETRIDVEESPGLPVRVEDVRLEDLPL